MSPIGLTIRDGSGVRRAARPFLKRYQVSDTATLSTDSNRTEAQDVIREGIRRGVVRVIPIPGCGTHVRVVRTQV